MTTCFIEKTATQEGFIKLIIKVWEIDNKTGSLTPPVAEPQDLYCDPPDKIQSYPRCIGMISISRGTQDGIRATLWANVQV